MQMIKYIPAVLFSFFLFFGSANLVDAKTNDVDIYFFHSEACPHCQEEEKFLDYYSMVNTAVKVHAYEVSEEGNAKLFAKVGQLLNKSISGVPFTVIGDQAITGYMSDSTTGKKIEQIVEQCIAAGGCPDPVGDLIAGKITVDQPGDDNPDNTNTDQPSEPKPAGAGIQHATLDSVEVPIFGEIEIKNMSLPIITIVFGALDGFNPCAMWALVFLISLLLGMHDRKRMWILGSVFIFTSGFVYFLFMAAWLQFVLFAGAVLWVRALIGLVALAGGGYNLREYFTNKDDTCKVSQGKQRQRIFERLKGVAHKKQFLLALGGIIALATAVNVVELICSAGLPAIYTSILAMSDLSTAGYYGYLFLYILIFMLDDLLVFFISMTTLKLVGMTTKYTRISHLVGGLLMVIIGLILIFAPGLLMFG